MQQATRRVEMFGVPVDPLTMDQTVERVRSLVLDGRPRQHVVLNAAKVVDLRRNRALAEAITQCDVVNADGMSIGWASRLLRCELPERVPGVDLMQRLVAVAEEDGHSVFFLGGRSDVVKRVVGVMQARHPRLKVAGYHDGFWHHDDEVINAVRRARPHYLFLALPSPRKELWLKHHLNDLGVPFVMGVGGSFDVLVGDLKRAPRLVQQSGFEWAWRLAQEPRRMWKRYLIGNTMFLALLVQQWWRRVAAPL
jgi:N-acetylglucosaminyldiphosphoundecaprenol N-acetyl-beta-D-mannosaminyltransferase